MKLLRAFVNYGLYLATAYRASFWISLVNTSVQMLAIWSLWNLLYDQRPAVFLISREQMITYGVLSVALSTLLTWWDGPHFVIADQVRKGTVVFDLIRPVHFLTRLVYQDIGRVTAVLITKLAPSLVAAFAVFKIMPPPDPLMALAFVISVVLAFVILTNLNILLGLISFLVVDIRGFQRSYHGIIMLLSGRFVPLWLLPPWLRSVADVLPFQGVFYTPLTIYAGNYALSDLAAPLMLQAFWAGALAVTVGYAWRHIQRHLVIQGG